MAEYNVNINVNDEEANRRLKNFTKQTDKIKEPINIKVESNNLSNVTASFTQLGNVLKIVNQNAGLIPGIGNEIQAIQQIAGATTRKVEELKKALDTAIYLSNPEQGLITYLSTAQQKTSQLINTTAQLGFTIFGIGQSVNILKASFGGFLDETIGKEIRLRDTLLQINTTLAGTNSVLKNGKVVENVAEQIQVLEGPVKQSIENLRIKSLEIAGTTSEAVVSTFQVVAQNIGSFGGTLKDAESLTVKFAGALGTLGMSNPMYARQEITSILQGNIDNNSALARTLGLTNADVAKAKQSAGGLMAYLEDRLQVFEVAQKKASFGFYGMTSNLVELQQEMQRAFGAPMLDPMLNRLEKLYKPLSENADGLMKVAGAAGQVVGSTVQAASNVVQSGPVSSAYTSENIGKTAKAVEAQLAKLAVYIQEQIARLSLLFKPVFDQIQIALVGLTVSFAKLAITVADLKIDKFQILAKTIEIQFKALTLLVNLYSTYISVINTLLGTDIASFFNEFTGYFKALEKIGVLPFARLSYSIVTLGTTIFKLVPIVSVVFAKIASIVGGTFAAIGGGVATLGAAIAVVGIKIVTTVIGIIRSIALAAQVLFRNISIGLASIAANLATTYPALAPLVPIIARIGVAFSGLSASAKKADIGVQAASVGMVANLQKVQVAADLLGVKITNMGTTIAAGAAKAGGALAGLAGGAIKGMIGSVVGFLALQLAITGIVMAIDKLKEKYDEAMTFEKHRAAMQALEGGLNAQAIAAAKAGAELDKTTKSLYDYQKAAALAVVPGMEKEIMGKIGKIAKLKNQNQKSDKDVELEGSNSSVLEDILAGRGVSTKTMNMNRFINGGADIKADDIRIDNLKIIKQLEKEISDIRKGVDNVKKTANEADVEKQKLEDIKLAAKKNMEAIAITAKFEKDVRRGIEDQIYQYKQQKQDVLIQIEQKRSDIEIGRIEEANRIVIRNSSSNAKEALQAFAGYISARKKGENDIEIKRKEAQIASANLDKEIAKMRLALEEQILEFRTKMNALDIEILDKRLQKEREIADIRNGVIVSDPANGGGGGGGSTFTSQEIQAATQSTSKFTGKLDQCALTVKAFYESLGKALPSVNAAALSTEKVGTIMRDWSKLQIGDIVNRGKQGDPIHTGVYTGENNVFHQSKTRGLKAGNFPDLGYFKEDGYFIRPNETNRLPGKGGAANTSAASPSQGQNKTGNMANYLKRLSYLESDLVNQPNKQGSPGRGYFQAFPEFTKEAKAASGGKDPRSGNYNEASQAAEAWIKKFNNDAYKLIQQGNTAGADKLLKGTWPSLPGGSQQQKKERYTQANKYLNPASTSSPENGETGATGKPRAVLGITFTGVEAAIAQLQAIKAQLAGLNEQAIKDDIGKRWTAFKETLQPSKEKLTEIDKQLQQSKASFEAVANASLKAYDPEKMALFQEFQDSNIETESKYANILKGVNEQVGTTAAVKKLAAEEIVKAQALEIKQNKEIYDRKLQIAEIDKAKFKIAQQLNDIEASRITAIGALLEAEKSIADKRARTPKEKRRNDVEFQMRSLENQQTKGGKEKLSKEQIKLNVQFKEQLIEQADALARFDEIAKGMQFENMLQAWSDELADTQGKIVGLTSTIKDEFSRAMNGAVQSVMSGNATISEAFGTMFQNIGQAFIQMATEMIAKALIMKVLGILMPGAGPAGGGALPGFDGASSGFGDFMGGNFGVSTGGLGGGDMSSFLGGKSFYGKRAMGGPVEANVPYLVGEIGPELFTPSGTGDISTSRDTAAAMAGANSAASQRPMLGGDSASSSPENGTSVYSSTQKGKDTNNSSVINNMISANKSSLSNSYMNQGLENPFSENRDTINNVTNNMKETARDAALGTTTSVNVNYNISRINSVDYVTADEFQSGISQATAAGAKQGKQKALAALRNEPGTRRSVGMR